MFHKYIQNEHYSHFFHICLNETVLQTLIKNKQIEKFLLLVTSAACIKNMKYILKIHFSQHFWIGLNDIAVEGNYVWEFQSNLQPNYESWHSGHGSGSTDDDDCVILLAGHNILFKGLWDEARCTSQNAYICEKEEGKSNNVYFKFLCNLSLFM